VVLKTLLLLKQRRCENNRTAALETVENAGSDPWTIELIGITDAQIHILNKKTSKYLARTVQIPVRPIMQRRCYAAMNNSDKGKAVWQKQFLSNQWQVCRSV
jgi:hypothetical protein